MHRRWIVSRKTRGKGSSCPGWPERTTSHTLIKTNDRYASAGLHSIKFSSVAVCIRFDYWSLLWRLCLKLWKIKRQGTVSRLLFADVRLTNVRKRCKDLDRSPSRQQVWVFWRFIIPFTNLLLPLLKNIRTRCTPGTILSVALDVSRWADDGHSNPHMLMHFCLASHRCSYCEQSRSTLRCFSDVTLLIMPEH